MERFSWGIKSTDGSRKRGTFHPWESLTFNYSPIRIGPTEFKCTWLIFPTGCYTKKQPHLVFSQEYSFVISTHLSSKCHVHSPDARWPFDYFARKRSFFHLYLLRYFLTEKSSCRFICQAGKSKELSFFLKNRGELFCGCLLIL